MVHRKDENLVVEASWPPLWICPCRAFLFNNAITYFDDCGFNGVVILQISSGPNPHFTSRVKNDFLHFRYCM